jgi:hypothetical protein
MEREHLKGAIKLWPGVAEELLGTNDTYLDQLGIKYPTIH